MLESMKHCVAMGGIDCWVAVAAGAGVAAAGGGWWVWFSTDAAAAGICIPVPTTIHSTINLQQLQHSVTSLLDSALHWANSQSET